MLVYKSTGDNRIAVLVLVCTGIFLVGILNLLPTTKGKGIEQWSTASQGTLTHQALGFQGAGAEEPGKRAIGGEFHFSFKLLEPPSYHHDNLSFKSLHCNCWEKYKFVLSSCAHKYVSKKSCYQESNYASIQSLHYWVLSQSADKGI